MEKTINDNRSNLHFRMMMAFMFRDTLIPRNRLLKETGTSTGTLSFSIHHMKGSKIITGIEQEGIFELERIDNKTCRFSKLTD